MVVLRHTAAAMGNTVRKMGRFSQAVGNQMREEPFLLSANQLV